MTIEIRKEGAFVVLTPAGDIGPDSSVSLEQRLKEQIQSGENRFILDMGRVTYIDSSGIGALVRGVRLLKGRSGSLTLVRCEPHVESVLRLVHLQDYLKILPTLEAALGPDPVTN